MPIKPAKLDLNGLDKLIHALAGRGFEVVGPVLRDHAVVLGPIAGAADLPAGWTADVGPGRYRTQPRSDGAVFGCQTGPESAKKYFHPARARIASAVKPNGEFHILDQPAPETRYALLGIRPCDLAAIAIQDRVLLGDRFVDDVYQSCRSGAFLVAVNCTEAAPTCFCASVGSGPRAQAGYDLALTEDSAGGAPVFLAEAGSALGAELLAEIGAEKAQPAWVQALQARVDAAAAQTRKVDLNKAREMADLAFEHPRWEQTGSRCLACGNCTLSCPTCFCINTEERTSVPPETAERWRMWDSCFTQNFSYIHGGSVRLTVKSRYRQWLSHKLARWQDQFGTAGCVGCGRCIVWCPVGIDITEEYAALAAAME
jgi:ferredoxin